MKPRSRRRSRPLPDRPGASSRETGRSSGDEAKRHLPPFRLALLLTLALFALSFAPRVSADPWLAGSFRMAAGALLALQLVLRRQVDRSRRVLHYDLVAVRVHYVQAVVQACVYVYWGWYWPAVYEHVPHIAAQLVFAYALDMLVCWFRRDRWALGFGQFPIIFSTNLFLWFRDEWFFLQFLLVATGVVGKQFVKWEREGRLTHVFNPSALSLFVFSIALIATGNTGITWGPEIAASLNLPPLIYLEIFLLGLVVQSLFSVTLVTLSAAAALYAMNLAYTGLTETYFFVITNIPIAVFLGLHLLVTDPATSPRTALGRILFGSLYGAMTFALFGALGWLGVPTFYDKLLCVPVLNLTVCRLDLAARRFADWARPRVPLPQWRPRRPELAPIGIWASLFVVMTGSGFISREHPGREPDFWLRACEKDQPNGCRNWLKLLEFSCRRDASACDTLGRAHDEGRLAPRNPLDAAKSFARACDQGLRDACTGLERLARIDGRQVLERACAEGDGDGCFILGELYFNGHGIPQDHAAALEQFDRACAADLTRGCARLGLSQLLGEGGAADPAKALASFEKACRGGHAGSCATAGNMYRRGTAGPGNETSARHWLAEACRLGLSEACLPGESPPPPRSSPDLDLELLKLGG